jgi:hypothetical protein
MTAAGERLALRPLDYVNANDSQDAYTPEPLPPVSALPLRV